MVQSLFPAGIEQLLITVAGWLLDYLAHSTVLLGIAWQVDEWTSIADDARLRSWLWKTAMVGGLLTATASMMTNVSSPLRLSVTEGEKAVLVLSEAAAEDAGKESASDSQKAGAGIRATSSSETNELDALTWFQSIGHDWPFLLVLLAVLAAVSSLLRAGWRFWNLRRRLRSREVVESGPIHAALREIEEAGRDPCVRLSRSDALVSPVTLPGNEICFPSRVAELDESETRALLAHELVHVRRGDPVALLALAGLVGLFAIQPLNRLARRRLTAIAEVRTDARVRELGLGPELASTLVTVSRWVHGTRQGSDFAGLAREEGIEQRVRRLLDQEAGDVVPGVGTGALMAGGIAALGAILMISPSARISTPIHPPHVSGGDGAVVRALERCDSAYSGTPTDAWVRWPQGRPVERGMSPLPSDLEAALASGDGVGLRLELVRAKTPFELTLRPGRGFFCWYGPSGNSLTLPVPSRPQLDSGRVLSLGIVDRDSGRHVLYLPPTIRRLTIVANGHVIRTGSLSRDGDLPRLLVPGG